MDHIDAIVEKIRDAIVGDLRKSSPILIGFIILLY
jgi:hypothetical protein